MSYQQLLIKGLLMITSIATTPVALTETLPTNHTFSSSIMVINHAHK